MIKKDSVYSIHAIAFTIVLGYPETVLFGHSIRGTGIERSSFLLWNFLYQTKEFGSGSLIYPCLLLHSKDTDSLQHTKCTDGIRFSCIFRYIKRNFHMALCGQVINFIRLYLLDNADQRTGICHIPIMKIDQTVFLHVTYPFIQIKMLDTCGVKRRGTAKDTMDFISFFN